MVRNALIAGATGLLGFELVSLLIANNYYTSVHIITRRPYNLMHRKIKAHIVDFENLNNFNPGVKIHDVFICLGTTMKKAGNRDNFHKVDLEYVMSVAHWAKHSHVEKLTFISSVGANPLSRNFYLSVKGKVEMLLSQLNFQQLVILRPSLLLGKRTEIRRTENIGKLFFKISKPLFTGKLKRYRAVEANMVARAMLFYSIQTGSAISIIENEQIFDLSNQPVNS